MFFSVSLSALNLQLFMVINQNCNGFKVFNSPLTQRDRLRITVYDFPDISPFYRNRNPSYLGAGWYAMNYITRDVTSTAGDCSRDDRFV